jgi:hypothetical protein
VLDCLSESIKERKETDAEEFSLLNFEMPMSSESQHCFINVLDAIISWLVDPKAGPIL